MKQLTFEVVQGEPKEVQSCLNCGYKRPFQLSKNRTIMSCNPTGYFFSDIIGCAKTKCKHWAPIGKEDLNILNTHRSLLTATELIEDDEEKNECETQRDILAFGGIA